MRLAIFARQEPEAFGHFAFEARKEAGASKTKVCCSWTWRRENGAPGSRRTRETPAVKVKTWREIAG